MSTFLKKKQMPVLISYKGKQVTHIASQCWGILKRHWQKH